MADRPDVSLKPATITEQPSVFHEAFDQIPTAIGDLGRGIAAHPIQFAEHAALTVGTSAGISFALSYILPAKSPFGLILGAGMMIPTVINVGKDLWNAHELAAKPGADTHVLGHQLADQAVAGTVDMGLNFLGGYAGAKGAYELNSSDTTAGAWSRQTRAWIQDKEISAFNGVKGLSTQAFSFLRSNPEVAAPVAGTAEAFQSRAITPAAAGEELPAAPNGLEQKFGNFHSHSSFTDGDGTPDQLYARAKAAGYDFWQVSEHNHDGARLGVEPGERATAEQGVPLLAQDPAVWNQIKASADAATVPGKFQAKVGEEMGVLGSVPPKLGPDGQPLPGGANHTILTNYDQTFVRTDRPNSPIQPSLMDRIMSPIMRLMGKDTTPPPASVADIPDGKFDLLAKYLNANEDPNNPAQAIGAHPRWLQDTAAKTPANLRLHDYGINEMGGVDQWADNYGSKHFVGMEVMKGEALNPGPLPILRPQDVDLTSYNGYMDLFADKVHAAPYAGLDTHFQARIGSPDAATGLLVSQLDDPGITAAVAARRSIATSSMSKLNGYMAANDGQVLMGQTVTAIPAQGLAPQVRINGQVTPDANYTANLWYDSKLGDGQLAKIVQTKTISGADLLSQGQTVAFNPVKPNAGDSAAFYVEVQRTAPDSPTFGEVLGTTPGKIESHEEALSHVLAPVEGPNGEKVIPNPADVLQDPEIAKAFDVDPSTPYPQRMITAPIWMQPAADASIHHSTVLGGLQGIFSHLVGSSVSDKIPTAGH